MSPTNLDQFHNVTEEQFELMLSQNDLLEIEVTCRMVNFAQDPLDVARDYSQALYIGERLAKHSKYMIAEEIEKENTFPNRFVVFSFAPNNPHDFILNLPSCRSMLPMTHQMRTRSSSVKSW